MRGSSGRDIIFLKIGYFRPCCIPVEATSSYGDIPSIPAMRGSPGRDIIFLKIDYFQPCYIPVEATSLCGDIPSIPAMRGSSGGDIFLPKPGRLQLWHVDYGLGVSIYALRHAPAAARSFEASNPNPRQHVPSKPTLPIQGSTFLRSRQSQSKTARSFDIKTIIKD